MNNPQPMNMPKDQNVLAFMMQLVQERYGDDVEIEFLNQESDRLYDDFGNNLVDYFEPMLTEEQKTSFDQLVSSSANQDQLLEFLINNIPNLEQQIIQVLTNFREEYLQAPME